MPDWRECVLCALQLPEQDRFLRLRVQIWLLRQRSDLQRGRRVRNRRRQLFRRRHVHEHQGIFRLRLQ